MFDLSFAELAIVVIAAIIFIGPKELPVVVRTITIGWRSVKKLSGELRGFVDEVATESGLKDIAEPLEYEMRMIRGNDGKLYESYAPIPDTIIDPHNPDPQMRPLNKASDKADDK